MSDQKMDGERRNLILATSAMGGVAVAAAAVPFVASFSPSERAKAAGASVVVDISGLKPGEKMVVKWRGKPVWILHRTQEMLDSLKNEKVVGKLKDPESKESEQPAYAKNSQRAIENKDTSKYLVVVGICTHLGCSPSDKLKAGGGEGMTADWQGGFLCPCHGSLFDLAGRVFNKMPAPTNLEIPPHKYLEGGTSILIGEDSESKEA